MLIEDTMAPVLSLRTKQPNGRIRAINGGCLAPPLRGEGMVYGVNEQIGYDGTIAVVVRGESVRRRKCVARISVRMCAV